jgi:murein DD-endopeptidase MepM/ murein hydrolase activator NlpD
MKMGDTGTSAGNRHLHFEIRYMLNVGSWTTNFNGFCGKQYINRMMADLAPYPYIQAWTTAYGFIRSCAGTTS